MSNSFDHDSRPNPVKRIVTSKTVTKLAENKTLVLLAKGSLGAASFFILGLLISLIYPSGKEPESLRTKELQPIRNSINVVQAEKDPLAREYRLQSEAKRLKLTSDEYRNLFAARRHSTDAFVSLPSSNNPWDYIQWFFLNLTRQQRMSLMWSGFAWVLEILPHLTIVFVGAKYLLDIPQRERVAKYQAWQVVHSAYGQRSSGARIEALQDLLEQGESLNSLSLEEGANLSNVQLPKGKLLGAKLLGADLSDADLHGAMLSYADLRSAGLSDADLSGADLVFANLSYANLSGADLHGAMLAGANFSNANLSNANLSNANLVHANLHGANLSGADLHGANLFAANLFGAKFSDANLSDAIFSNAILLATDLRNAKNFDPELIESHQPLLCNVALPEDFKDKDKLKDRDCDRLPQELLKLDPQSFKSLEEAKECVNEARQKKWE